MFHLSLKCLLARGYRSKRFFSPLTAINIVLSATAIKMSLDNVDTLNSHAVLIEELTAAVGGCVFYERWKEEGVLQRRLYGSKAAFGWEKEEIQMKGRGHKESR
jgi:hypothetical protein